MSGREGEVGKRKREGGGEERGKIEAFKLKNLIFYLNLKRLHPRTNEISKSPLFGSNKFLR